MSILKHHLFPFSLPPFPYSPSPDSVSLFSQFSGKSSPSALFLFPLKLARDWPFTQASRECESQEQSLMKLGENNHVVPNCIQDFSSIFLP